MRRRPLLDSWDDVFDPDTIAKFKDCGIHLLDSSDDIMSAALHYLQLDPNSSDPADLQKAADLLTKIRPYVRKFHSSEYLNALATGEICFGGRLFRRHQAGAKARRRSQGRRRHRLFDPERGRAIVVRQSSPSRRTRPMPAEAHALINYLLKPEVAAKNTNFISYANGNLASQKFIDKSILDDPTIYPDAAVHGEALHHHRRTIRRRSG